MTSRRKKSLQSYCSVDFDFLALMQFNMTFDVMLRDDSSFGKLAIFKKNTCGNPPTQSFLGLLNQVLAFVKCEVKKNILGLCCCFPKAL